MFKRLNYIENITMESYGYVERLEEESSKSFFGKILNYIGDTINISKKFKESFRTKVDDELESVLKNCGEYKKKGGKNIYDIYIQIPIGLDKPVELSEFIDKHLKKDYSELYGELRAVYSYTAKVVNSNDLRKALKVESNINKKIKELNSKDREFKKYFNVNRTDSETFYNLYKSPKRYCDAVGLIFKSYLIKDEVAKTLAEDIDKVATVTRALLDLLDNEKEKISKEVLKNTLLRIEYVSNYTRYLSELLYTRYEIGRLLVRTSKVFK
jgi:hypothetical protein